MPPRRASSSAAASPAPAAAAAAPPASAVVSGWGGNSGNSVGIPMPAVLRNVVFPLALMAVTFPCVRPRR